MSPDNVVRLSAAIDQTSGSSFNADLIERRVPANSRAAMARRTDRNAVVQMIARHFPAAAALYGAAYALPQLDLIEPSNAAIASWCLLGLAGLLYFRISLTGWAWPLLFTVLAAGAVYAMKEGAIPLSDIWLSRARDVLTLCTGTFIASVLFTMFSKR